MDTIEKRGESYKIIVSCGYDLDGKQLRRRMVWKPEPGMTKRQIQKELDRQAVLFEEKCRNGQVLEGNIKFAEFAEKWFADYAEKQLRATTVARYQLLMPRINAAIGHIRLDKLQPHHLMEFYNNLAESGVREDTRYCSAVDFKKLLKKRGITKRTFAKEAGVSVYVLDSVTRGANISTTSAHKIVSALGLPLDQVFTPVGDKDTLAVSTILHHHRLISSMLGTAVKWQLIFSNPCSRVVLPKNKRKEAVYLDEEQAAQLLRKYRIPLLVFLLGVALALVPGKTKKTDAQQTTAASANTAFDLSATQKQLEALLSAIDGAGRVRLMLTLSSGEQIIYQTDSRTVTASGSTTQETQTVFRQPGGSEKEPAVQSTVYPTYQGALVVCDGAERASVRLAVTQAVSSLTGLGSNKIAVVKMKGQ